MATDAGKGSARRPTQVSQSTLDANWASIFGKKLPPKQDNRATFKLKLEARGLWYREEILELLRKHELQEYEVAIKVNGMYRWYPSEVIACIDKFDAQRSSGVEC